MIEQVDDLDGALDELVRVMKRDARLLISTTFATEYLDGHEAEMMRHHLGNVDQNLDRGFVEAAFKRGRLRTGHTVVIGTEWRE